MLAPDVELILSNTDRLITTFRCVVSLGLGDGPEEILSTKPPENKPDWHEAVAGFQRDTQKFESPSTRTLAAEPS